MAMMMACGRGDARPQAAPAPRVAFDSLFRVERAVRLQTSEADPIGQVTDLQLWRGQVVVVDEMQSNVKLFGMDGRLLRVVGRAGDGPGEFRRPFRATPLRDGRLAVLERPTLRISFFGEDGAYRTGWHVPGIAPGGLFQVPGTGELLVLARLTELEADRSASALALHTYTLEGRRTASFRPFPELEDDAENNFDTMAGALVGSIAVTAPYSRNRIHHHDLRTGREWEVPVGEGVWTPPQWPRQRFVRLSDLTAWAQRQMWTMRLVDLDGEHYAVRFTRYHPETRAPFYRYAVVRARDGATRWVTGPAGVDLAVADGGRIYASRMDAGGNVDLLVLRLMGTGL